MTDQTRPGLTGPYGYLVRRGVDIAIAGSDLNKNGVMEGNEFAYAARQVIAALPCSVANGILDKVNTNITQPGSELAAQAKESLKGDKALLDTILDEIKQQYSGKVMKMEHTDLACILRTGADKLERCAVSFGKRDGWKMDVPPRCPSR